jgi:hypothetical protein
MDWFFIWFRKRMLEASKRRDEGIALVSTRSEVVKSGGSPTDAHGHKRIELLSAVNGKVLEIAHRKTPHVDWEITLYIVRDDESLADAIATALLVTGEN